MSADAGRCEEEEEELSGHAEEPSNVGRGQGDVSSRCRVTDQRHRPQMSRRHQELPGRSLETWGRCKVQGGGGDVGGRFREEPAARSSQTCSGARGSGRASPPPHSLPPPSPPAPPGRRLQATRRGAPEGPRAMKAAGRDLGQGPALPHCDGGGGGQSGGSCRAEFDEDAPVPAAPLAVPPTTPSGHRQTALTRLDYGGSNVEWCEGRISVVSE
ncbi:unnamed protein product [Lampetra planeri]